MDAIMDVIPKVTADEHIQNRIDALEKFPHKLYSLNTCPLENIWIELEGLTPQNIIAILGILSPERESMITEFIQQWVNQDDYLERISPEKRRQYQALIREIQRLKQSGILHKPLL